MEGRGKDQQGAHEWGHFVSSLGEKEEVEIQDCPASGRLFNLLLMRKDLEMSV